MRSRPRAAAERLDHRAESLGPAWLVVNNACVAIWRRTWDLDRHDWSWVLGANLFGVISTPSSGSRRCSSASCTHSTRAWASRRSARAGSPRTSWRPDDTGPIASADRHPRQARQPHGGSDRRHEPGSLDRGPVSRQAAVGRWITSPASRRRRRRCGMTEAQRTSGGPPGNGSTSPQHELRAPHRPNQARGSRDRRPRSDQRAKSRSRLHSSSPCSMAIAARCASLTSRTDG